MSRARRHGLVRLAALLLSVAALLGWFFLTGGTAERRQPASLGHTGVFR
jgi:hypothetical protein